MYSGSVGGVCVCVGACDRGSAIRRTIGESSLAICTGRMVRFGSSKLRSLPPVGKARFSLNSDSLHRNLRPVPGSPRDLRVRQVTGNCGPAGAQGPEGAAGVAGPAGPQVPRALTGVVVPQVRRVPRVLTACLAPQVRRVRRVLTAWMVPRVRRVRRVLTAGMRPAGV